jgi:RimJ/RimL family protein N-acetyltransferase
MDFDAQPELRGELVHARPLTQEDFDALLEAASDPLIWELHPDDRYRPDVFRDFFAHQLGSGGGLLVTDARTGEVIGTSRFDNLNRELREVEIGWTFLRRSHWGGTANGELKRLMLTHAFHYVESVVFMVHSSNLRSRRAVTRIGGIHEGQRPNANGLQREVFRITRASFEAGG